MDKNILEKNSRTLQKELAWLSEVLHWRFELYFKNEPGYNDVSEIAQPDLTSDDSLYASTVRRLNLNLHERLVLILALTPEIKPELPDIFFTKNANYDRAFTEFGGIKGKNHSGFIPTGTTALFMLAGGDIGKHMEARALLKDSSLFRESILKPLVAEADEPEMSAPLACSKEFLARLMGTPVDDESTFPVQRLHTTLGWEDVILDNDTLEAIEGIKTWIEHGDRLPDQYPNLRIKIQPGLTCLLYGPHGAGKSLVTTLLGQSAGREVYRVDLSPAFSKYIGETEKNLQALFKRAEEKQWILFFDEVDAIFGKRTNVTDAHDRYANQEVSYLLRLIEDFPGVVVLAAEKKAGLDEALLRRLQLVVHFPVPAYPERLKLWTRAFKQVNMLSNNIDFEHIAKKYELTGGSIINILRYCLVHSKARQKTKVSQEDIIDATRKELDKVKAK